jgi:hypothetical protein
MNVLPVTEFIVPVPMQLVPVRRETECRIGPRTLIISPPSVWHIVASFNYRYKCNWIPVCERCGV